MDDSIGEYSTSSRASYVSCMKINGVPLIPPLMTPEYRQEMQYYKQLAMAVERRLYDLKICLDETTMNSNMLRSDSEEWCDGVNLSIMSSKSENQTISNQFKKPFRNVDVKFKNEVFENNDFESMNSQVTVIDNDPENSTASNVGKDDYSESFASSSIDVFTTETNTSLTKKSDDSDTCNQSKERKFKSSVISPTSHTRSTKNNDKDTDFAKQNRSLPNGIQHFNNKDNLNVEGKAKISNSKEVFKIEKSHSKSSITKISTSASKTKKEISNRKDKINQPKNVSLSSSKKSEIILKNTSNLLKLRKKPLPLDKNRTKLSPSKNVTGSLNNISSGLASPPKLFRQNSYTLEYPSPLLLAHLEEKSLASGIDLRSISMSESTSTSFLCNSSKQKSWDSNTAKETWSSIGSDINSISMNETSEINPSAKEKLGIKENKGPISNIVDRNTNELLSNESHFKCLDRSVDPSETFEKSSSNVIEYYEKDKDDNVADDLLYVNPIYETPIKSKLVNQNILLSSNSCDRLSTRDNMQLLPSVVNLSSKPNVDSNIYFNKLLKKFQDEHDKKLNELIRKQNEEQIFLKKTFENQQKLLLTQFQIAFNQNKHISEDNFEKNSDHSNFGGLKNGHSDISAKEKHEINPQERLDNKTEKKVQASEILNTEKYLTMSSDVISKSKHKISNQQASLNASYTIDLVPTQENKAIHAKSSCEKNPIQLHDDARLKKPMDKLQTESKPVDKTNNICLYPEVQTIDYNKFSSKEYYCDDSQLDDSIATERTSNTLDDVNFTFASDDASSANECKSHYETFISNPMHREADGMSKLKSAFDKITKIQQNLASQPNYRERSYSTDKNYYKDNTYASSSNQIISLSSISSKSSAYFDSSSQNSIVDKNSLSLNLIEVNRPRNDGIVQKCYRKILQYNEKEIQAATIIVAYTKGYLTRRLMRTERVESTVQTIRDTLLCALQLHRDEGGIQGADVDLHRRLIQQITAACYALHDMFIIFTPAERMSIISQDRDRKISLSHRSSSSTSSTRQLSATTQKILKRKLEGMSKSHTGVFTTKPLRTSHLASQQMTRSHYEHNDQLQSGISDKSRRSVTVTGEHVSRKPWR